MIALCGKQVRVRVAGIVVTNGRILLIAHKKRGREYWLVPGGGIDYGESAKDALVREMREELSVRVVVGDLAFACDSIDPSGGRHVVNLFFRCEIESGTPELGKDRRLSRFDFFSVDEILRTTIHPPCGEQLVCLMKGIAQPLYQGSIWEK
jgi:8-oxo-dGTP diphosphatase